MSGSLMIGSRERHEASVLEPSPPSFVRRLLLTLFGPHIRAWRGQAPLGLVLMGHFASVAFVLIVGYVDAALRADSLAQQGLLTTIQLHTAWALVAVWRCAANARHPWTVVARLFIVAWTINVFLVTIFLQIDLLTG